MLSTTRLFRGSPKSVSVSSHSGSQSSTLCARILQEPGVYTSTFDLSEASRKGMLGRSQNLLVSYSASPRKSARGFELVGGLIGCLRHIEHSLASVISVHDDSAARKAVPRDTRDTRGQEPLGAKRAAHASHDKTPAKAAQCRPSPASPPGWTKSKASWMTR